MLFKRQKLPGVLLHRPADANEITQTPPFCSTPLARWGAACTSRGAIIVRVFIVRPPGLTSVSLFARAFYVPVGLRRPGLRGLAAHTVMLRVVAVPPAVMPVSVMPATRAQHPLDHLLDALVVPVVNDPRDHPLCQVHAVRGPRDPDLSLLVRWEVLVHKDMGAASCLQASDGLPPTADYVLHHLWWTGHDELPVTLGLPAAILPFAAMG
mmetsp:Transcript_20796/g.57967  ORF Transcript_20796/g.57967 Transcript_20796/m.57967 type:complete len:210 (+) Transcript_20796:559-1188(+)